MTGVLKRMADHADRVNDYFANAVRVWAFAGDEAAHEAALTAAKVAGKLQRRSMVDYLLGLSDDISRELGAEAESTCNQLKVLGREICEKDWGLAHVFRAKLALAKVDRGYAKALDRADPNVFARRWPELFHTANPRLPELDVAEEEQEGLEEDEQSLDELARELASELHPDSKRPDESGTASQGTDRNSLFCCTCGKSVDVDWRFCRFCGASQPGESYVRTTDQRVENLPSTSTTIRTGYVLGFVFGIHLLLACGLTLFLLLNGLDTQLQPAGTAGLLGGLFFLALGVPMSIGILLKKVWSIRLVLATTVLVGMGTIIRGFIPLDILVLGIMIAFSFYFTRRKHLMN